MDNLFKYLKGVVTIVGTTLTWLFGFWDTPLMVLVCFIVLDYCAGVIRAWINKELSSKVGFRGIVRKSVILMVLIVSVLLDRLLNIDVWIFRSVVCYFYISNEGISILENCAGLGLPIPEKLKSVLLQLKSEEKKELNEFEVNDNKGEI